MYKLSVKITAYLGIFQERIETLRKIIVKLYTSRCTKHTEVAQLLAKASVRQAVAAKVYTILHIDINSV